MPNLFRRGGEYSTPATVLGFYAGVLAILELGVVGALGVLASNDHLHHLIPWVLGFGAVVLVALIVVVVTMNVRDPSKLQLGKMTAREYIEVQKMTLGDSIAGEYVEEVPALTDPSVIDGTVAEIPRRTTEETQARARGERGQEGEPDA